jgi:hypothetical protein
LTCDKKTGENQYFLAVYLVCGLWDVFLGRLGIFVEEEEESFCVCVWMIAPRHYEWPFVCCTPLLSLSLLLLLLLPPSPFVNVGVGCRSEKRKSTSAANEEAEKEVCRVRVSLYYVCLSLSARLLTAGAGRILEWTTREVCPL